MLAAMDIYPSHSLALALWRAWSVSHPVSLRDFHESGKRKGLSFPAHQLAASAHIKSCARTRADIERIALALPEDVRDSLDRGGACPGERAPWEVLVGKSPGARSTDELRRHQCALTFPRNAFFEMAPQVWVSSPELVFAQMAGRLEYGELLALGYELCGCYPIDGGNGFLVRCPLTTPERLRAFLGQMRNARAVKLARSAAQQVRRKSASIMETELAIVSLTPRRRGGLGLPDARLNEPLILGEKGGRVARRQRVVGDLCWVERSVIVEYNGRESHRGVGAQVRDSRRHDALLAEGIDMTTVTSSQFANVYEFSELMGDVSRKVGKTFRGWAPGQIESHMELRQQVRSFHHRHFPRSSA